MEKMLLVCFNPHVYICPYAIVIKYTYVAPDTARMHYFYGYCDNSIKKCYERFKNKELNQVMHTSCHEEKPEVIPELMEVSEEELKGLIAMEELGIKI